MCANYMNKPFYVMAESIKFVKEYPLNQSDIPEEFKVNIILLVILFLYYFSTVPLC